MGLNKDYREAVDVEGTPVVPADVVTNYNHGFNIALGMYVIIITAELALGRSGGELGLDQRWRRAADYFSG